MNALNIHISSSSIPTEKKILPVKFVSDGDLLC